MKKIIAITVIIIVGAILGKKPLSNMLSGTDFKISKIIYQKQLAQGDYQHNFIDENNSGYERGDELIIGSVMVTSGETNAVIEYENGQVFIMEDTSVKVLGKRKLGVSAGKVFLDLKGEFEVETEYVTAGVEGTRFFVSKKGQASQVGVIRGKVRVKSKSSKWEPILLETGMEISVNEDDIETHDVLSSKTIKYANWKISNIESIVVPNERTSSGSVNYKDGNFEASVKYVLKRIYKAETVYNVDTGKFTDNIDNFKEDPFENKEIIIEFLHADDTSFEAIGWHVNNPGNKWSINANGNISKY